MAKLLEEVFTIIFFNDKTGFKFLLLNTKKAHKFRGDNGESCYVVKQSDLKLLDQAEICYEFVEN